MKRSALVTNRGSDEVGACSVRWWHRLAARSIGACLDRRIADGAPVDSDSGLVVRGHWLLSRPARDRLADAWSGVASDACATARLGDPRIPMRRGEVTDAAPMIAELVGILQGRGPVTARGVAMGRRLITDGSGPLYAGGRSLRKALRAVLEALDPMTELSDAA